MLIKINIFSICAPKSIQNTIFYILVGIRFRKTKNLSTQTLTIISKVGFLTMVFFILIVWGLEKIEKLMGVGI